MPKNILPVPQRPTRQFVFVTALALLVASLIFLYVSHVFIKLALIDASQKGNMRVVSLLLKAGADPNADDEGQTPLLMAVEGQHLDAVRLLVDHGANVEGRGAFGNTPLTASVGNKDSAIDSFLLEHGADVNAQNASGETLLMEVASNADSEIVQILLAHHANVNLRDADGQTALLQAVSIDYPVNATNLVSTVKALVNHGANLNALDSHGQNALMLAKHYKHTNLTEMLEQASDK